MTKKNSPSTLTIGLTVLSVVFLAASAYMMNTTFHQNPILIALGLGTFATDITDPSGEIYTNQFSSIQEFNDFVKNNQNSGGVYYDGFARGGAMIETLGAPVPMATGVDMVVTNEAKSLDGVESQGADYSQTNVQVEGVDEADIIKTDGEYIYTITGNTLFIVRAYPGEDAEIISKIEFENYPKDIFVNGDKLAVFGDFNDIEFFKKIDFSPRYGMSFFDVYDISDKENPEIIEEYKFEGNYFKARMKGDYVYFLSTQRPEYRIDYPTPLIIKGEEKIAMPVTDIYYYNINYRNPRLMTVHAINIANPSQDIDSKSVFVEYDQNLYMSNDNIFVTYTQQINEYDIQKKIIMQLMDDKISDSDKMIIEKIKQTDNDVLSQYEKEQKIYYIYQTHAMYLTQEEQDTMRDEAERLLKEELSKYDHFEYTVINKLGFDNGQISVESNGKVPGRTINQFSMDENDNVFRIATTISARWSSIDNKRTKSTNGVYTLDSNMNIIGKLEGLAETEQIYSTRFIGDKLYMVTFRQVDPFFVIDLSNPNDIKNLGKLKIPGFSRYLHPYDENTIIGIGQDTTEGGRTAGLKISLFDVSDITNPKEIAKFVTEERYATSTALYNHHAFLFSKEKELLVIPAYSNSYTYRGQKENGYNGAFVFHITKDEIKLRGLIDHSKGSNNYWSPQVERSLYIENLLYTKSPDLLRISKIDDLSSVKDIELKTGTTENIPIY